MMRNKSSLTSDIYEDDDDDDFYHEKSNSDKMYIFEEKIASLIAEDDKDQLVQLLRSPRGRALVELNKADPQLPSFILRQCICNDASNCATAFLEGETGVTPYINKWGMFPLHAAARILSPKMTRYFLKFGILANAKGPGDRHLVKSEFGFKVIDDPEVLPVDSALHSTRNRVVWKQGQSLFKLLVKLTGYGMYNSLETVILLMNHLSCSEITEVICRYAIEGKVIELATLLLGLSENHLMVDELYMPNNDVSSGDRLTLRQYVVNQIVVLENELGKLVAIDSVKLAKCKEMKKSMMSILMLLEIFLRAQEGIAKVVISREFSEGDDITIASDYCKKMPLNSKKKRPAVPFALARELEKSGLKLTSQDAAYLRGIIDWNVFPISSMKDLRIARKQYQSDELPRKVKRYFPSGLPPLSSFATMADFGWDESDPKHEKLRAALKELSSGINTSYWTPNQSILKLIIVLCLPEMKRKLEAIRLLAQNIEKINEIACCYAKEGKLIELVIVLMVAWEKVRDPLMFQIKGDDSARSMTFQQFINSELAQAVDLEYRFIRRTTEQEKELSMLCKQRKVAMMSALPLVEIFEKADTIRSYLWSDKNIAEKERVVKDVKKLLGEAGFKLKSKDIEVGDINESSKDLGVKQLDETMQDLTKIAGTRKSGSRRRDLKRLSYVPPCGFVETYGAYGRPNDMRNFLFTRYPRECNNSSSAARSYRALWSSKAYCTSAPKALEVQERRDVFRGLKFPVQKFPTSKQLASVVLVVRKIIKYA